MKKESILRLNYIWIFTVGVTLSALTLLLFTDSFEKRTPASLHKINIVLDIDYTIVRPAHNSKSEKVFEIQGEKYILHDWARELVEFISRNENFNLYFFSGGKSLRNEKLLKYLTISNGQSFYELATDIYSFHDLTHVAKTGRFSHQYKKRLISIGLEPAHSLLIDDNFLFSYSGEEKSMLWLGESFHQYDQYEFSKKDIGNKKVIQKYIPKNRDAWFIDQSKLKFVLELLADYDGRDNFLSYIATNKINYIPYDNKLNSFHRILLDRGNTSFPSCQSVLQFGQ